MEDMPENDVVKEHHNWNGFLHAPDPQRLCDIHSGHQDPTSCSQDPPLSEGPVSDVPVSVLPGELTGSATKFHSYPHKFCEIIKHAKQLAQCEAALDPFPIKTLFLDKSAMYITEAITKHTEKVYWFHLVCIVLPSMNTLFTENGQDIGLSTTKTSVSW